MLTRWENKFPAYKRGDEIQAHKRGHKFLTNKWEDKILAYGRGDKILSFKGEDETLTNQ